MTIARIRGWIFSPALTRPTYRIMGGLFEFDADKIARMKICAVEARRRYKVAAYNLGWIPWNIRQAVSGAVHKP